MESLIKKFTRSTLKSILKNNKCSIMVNSSFDGMTDCVQRVEGAWKEIDKASVDFAEERTFGISGLWLVGSSRDLFTVSGNTVEIYNCCGSCTIKFE